jgi:DNA-binding NarL/FixJ family response regulator
MPIHATRIGRGSGRGYPMRLVIVEDPALLRSAITRALTVAGIVVVAEAATAEQALGVAREHRPNLMLVDIDLPGLGGAQLVRELALLAGQVAHQKSRGSNT